MSDGEEKLPQIPAEVMQLEPRGYYLAAAFHPAIPLSRKKGFEFAAALSEYIEPSNAELGEEKWRFSQPMPGSTRSTFSVTISQAVVQIAAEFPTHRTEWFEDRQRLILKQFGEVFQPEMILNSAAMVRGTLAIGGDARDFLWTHLMNLSPGRAAPLARPIHIVGLRLAFPPYHRKTPEGVELQEWALDVKVESLGEDPTKVYLEADAKWMKPRKWDAEAVGEVVNHLDVVLEYLRKNVLVFLKGQDTGGHGEDNE